MKSSLLFIAAFAALAQITQAQTANSIFDEAVISPPAQLEASSKVEATFYSTASKLHKNTTYTVQYAFANEQVEGFDFTNFGPNNIIPIPDRGLGAGPTRDYSFEFPNRANQDMKLTVVDTPDEIISNLMNSYFYFYPRKHLPAIQWADDDSTSFKVILPNGEEVFFNKKTKEIVGGVLKETGPIDMGPDRNKRKFPLIEYTGSGVMIRVDKRGADPRLFTTATITQGTKTCKVPAGKLFDQDVHSMVLFLYKTDAEFAEFLKKTCNMTL